MKQFCIVFWLIIGLTACGNGSDEEISAGKFGMMSDETPQYTAVVFMNAIYKDKTLDRAVKLSSKRFAKILKNHHTNRNVQRHVFNLRLNDVSVDPMSGTTSLFAERSDKAKIDMKITGTFDGKQIVDLRTISMVKGSNGWEVTDVSNTVP